ncbi:PREDICTED: double-stranded RNA-binding protein 1-like [Ipomoea nil]|uniref:double-stranded RNA-binding protein 1-like n=1 Tax=Ipomoea nil TaxID=35883 RepID=UPI000901CAA7|nr:PREDICTED: double-stranded RNA-binding protein 1-like [Ipomoea nil]
MSASESFQGVSNCYVFKSRLQEYAQKVGLPTPVYETIKEGPSHEPTFRSTVIVSDTRYDSLPGFFNRKAAEQSAAEVALVELSRSGERKECISQPVHDTGLCKNLLQEYAQKMNFAIPLYECRKEEATGKPAMYACTVEIGGVKYIGASARTKKEAELKAARTALLAIESDPSKSNNRPTDYSSYTVLPLKKKVADLGISHQETAAALKPKRGRAARLKKKSRKKRKLLPKSDSTGSIDVTTDEAGPELGTNDATALEVTDYGVSHMEMKLELIHTFGENDLGGTAAILGVGEVNPVDISPTLCQVELHSGMNVMEEVASVMDA